MRPGRCLVPALGALLPDTVFAQAEGAPRPWEWWHQPPATNIMERIDQFHYFLFWIMVGICALVFALLIYVLIRYNARRNPVPSRTSHNTVIEVLWTIVPVLILVAIAIPSFRLLYLSYRIPDAEMTVNVVGRQWFWEYEYPDHGDFIITSLMIPEEELGPDQPRLLAVDNPVVLPVDTTIRFLITSGDVNHAWAVPSFGVKRDAIPGRTNESWARIEEEGTYYGQCSEICGTGHAYMPITVEVVSKEAFAEWVEEAQAEFAAAAPDKSRVQVAEMPDSRRSENEGAQQ